jgi:hypothetical protein
MNFKLLATTAPSLQQQLQWLFHSPSASSFITGDEHTAFSIPVASPGSLSPLTPARPSEPFHPCNLPIPADLYTEFASRLWHGFRFLDASAYDTAKDNKGLPAGDLLRTLLFNPDYGHYVLHPATGLILALRSGSLQLLNRTTDGFTPIGQTRTRGKATLAFAAHPTEPLIAYGDNAGTFTAHRYEPTGFTKASKIAAKDRKASRLEFSSDGSALMLGGMGYLATFSYENGKFSSRHETSIAVRDFAWLQDKNLVFVNQGLHGLTAFNYSPQSGFTKLAELKPSGGVNQMSASDDARHLAATSQESSAVTMYAIM